MHGRHGRTEIELTRVPHAVPEPSPSSLLPRPRPVTAVPPLPSASTAGHPATDTVAHLSCAMVSARVDLIVLPRPRRQWPSPDPSSRLRPRYAADALPPTEGEASAHRSAATFTTCGRAMAAPASARSVTPTAPASFRGHGEAGVPTPSPAPSSPGRPVTTAVIVSSSTRGPP